MSMESLYEYGARVGVWRILDLFKRYDVPLTVYGVAMAMERNPAVVEAFMKAGHEVASHGWRWVNYQPLALEVEREHMQRAIGLHCRLVGRPGRLASLERFLKYVARKPKVWITRRIEIARHWLKRHPYV